MALTKSISDVTQGNPITTTFQPIKAEFSTLLTELQDGSLPTYKAAQILATAAVGISGYDTGSGGTVTQITSKATTVVLSKPSGRITTHAAALAANTTVRFTVTNTLVALADAPLVAIQSPATKYRAWVDTVAAGSFVIALENITAGSLSEAVLINVNIFKGATA